MNAHTTGLLERAADDEATMHLAGISEVPFGQHAQAAVEKLLKALINEHGIPYLFTHDIGSLAQKLINMGETLPMTPVSHADLTDYAMDLCKEESSLLPPPLVRQACVDTGEIIGTPIKARVQTLGLPPPLAPPP